MDIVVSKCLRPERTIIISRTLNASCEEVFQMWTNPVHLARWWGPKGYSTPVCEVDARPGGRLYIVMRSPDGIDYAMDGIFQEIIVPTRITFTNNALDSTGMRVLEGYTEVTITDAGNSAILTVHSKANALVDGAERMLQGMELGWTESLECLVDNLT